MKLYVNDTAGGYRPATPKEIIQAANSCIGQVFGRGSVCDQPQKAAEFLRLRLAPQEHEIFGALWLDTRHRVIAFEELFRGTIDGCSVHPREVVKSALTHNATAVIFAHNHPSGESTPSDPDRKLTKQLKEALGLIDVRVLDHLIVGEGETYSLAEHGLM